MAWDGEGADTGRIIEGAREHRMTLLSNSTGVQIYRKAGLSTSKCLSMLADAGRDHPEAIHVIFAGQYDCNNIMRALSREQLIHLLPPPGGARTTLTYRCRSGIYRLQWIPRKYLRVQRLALTAEGKPARRMKRNGQRVPIIDATITLWDVFGYFQSSFTQALERWRVDSPDLDLIKRGKAARGEFASWTRRDLARYNAAELDALVLLAGRLRDAIAALDLKITRWDGAGSVAASMLTSHSAKSYLGALPAPAEQAAQHAYFGGRIERGQFGAAGATWAYDINSAYPAAMVTVPDLTTGSWQHYDLDGRPGAPALHTLPLFTLVRVRWHASTQARYHALPFRLADGRVTFPATGLGWYWLPEVLAALEVSGEYEPLEAWTYYDDGSRPWEWVRAYYGERQAMLAGGQVGGAELVIKLGLNSLYGKTAQTAGYSDEEGSRPPYHSIAVAGYITSTTRAALFRAVTKDPDAVIMLATDGVFTTRPLDLPIPHAKELGAWGVTKYAQCVAVASGVYFTRKPGGEWMGLSRGYDRAPDGDTTRARLAQVLEGWQSGATRIYWPCTRLIGAGTAMASDLQYRRWCSWYESVTEEGIPGRAVQLIPNELKRVAGFGRSVRRPDLALRWTSPCYGLGSDHLSERYQLPWDAVQAAEGQRENDDANL